MNFLDRMIRKFLKMQRGGQGDPKRFDKSFSLNVQGSVVRRAERKRERKGRLRRLNRACGG
jgi:hypothetical protein